MAAGFECRSVRAGQGGAQARAVRRQHGACHVLPVRSCAACCVCTARLVDACAPARHCCAGERRSAGPAGGLEPAPGPCPAGRTRALCSSGGRGLLRTASRRCASRARRVPCLRGHSVPCARCGAWQVT
jgi:hypothetical protein